jgi:hypothetical protein
MTSALVATVLALACELDGHGPFSLPVASTSLVPRVYCLTCGADCTRLIRVEAGHSRLLVWNFRRDPAVVFTWDGSHAVIPPRTAVPYYRGRFELDDYTTPRRT